MCFDQIKAKGNGYEHYTLTGKFASDWFLLTILNLLFIYTGLNKCFNGGWDGRWWMVGARSLIVGETSIGWTESSFGFLCAALGKNPKELFGQPNNR